MDQQRSRQKNQRSGMNHGRHVIVGVESPPAPNSNSERSVQRTLALPSGPFGRLRVVRAKATNKAAGHMAYMTDLGPYGRSAEQSQVRLVPNELTLDAYVADIYHKPQK